MASKRSSLSLYRQWSEPCFFSAATYGEKPQIGRWIIIIITTITAAAAAALTAAINHRGAAASTMLGRHHVVSFYALSDLNPQNNPRWCGFQMTSMRSPEVLFFFFLTSAICIYSKSRISKNFLIKTNKALWLPTVGMGVRMEQK